MRLHNQKYFYKYLSAKTAKIVLINQTLRWSSPLMFNDPFDVVRKLKFNFKFRELQEKLIDLAYEIHDKPTELAKYSGSKFRMLCYLINNTPKMGKSKIKEYLNPTSP